MSIVWRFLFCIIALQLLPSPGIAQPFDHILQKAYVVDAEASLNIDDVRQRPVQPFNGVLSRGFTDAATWIRITVAPVTEVQPGEMLVVRIRPSYLDEIRLYDPLDTSGRQRVAGDHTDWQRSEFKSLNHGFLIPAADAPRDVWLRLKTSSTSMIHVEVLTPEEAQQANRMQEMFYGLLMGTLVLFFLWAVLQLVLRREALMAAFVLNQAAAATHAAVYVGYVRMIGSNYFTVAGIERFSLIVFCGVVLVGIVFHVCLLREFRPWRPGLVIAMGVELLAFGTEMVLIAMDKVMWAMRLNTTVVAVSMIVFWLISLSCRIWAETGEDDKPAVPKWMVVGFYTLLTFMFLLAASPALGLAQAPEINLHSYLIHGVMTGLLLIALLQVRAYRIEESRNREHLRARSAAQQVEIEKQRSQLQGRFMEMLAHELKTSLSVLHMVFGAPKPNPAMLEHGRRTVNSINQLIERCLQAEQFEDDEVISHFEIFSVDDLISEVLAKMPDAARVTTQCDESLLVNSDWQIIKSVLSNLIDNALKYSSPESTVSVRAARSEREGRAGCEISVQNTVVQGAGSSGFPDRDELFKKYYRAEGARKHSGSGLGLYLVANFMRLLGGDVSYEPLDNSVRFTLWLPN